MSYFLYPTLTFLILSILQTFPRLTATLLDIVFWKEVLPYHFMILILYLSATSKTARAGQVFSILFIRSNNKGNSNMFEESTKLCDVKYKIVFLGQSAVGKSAIIDRFIQDRFDNNKVVLVTLSSKL